MNEIKENIFIFFLAIPLQGHSPTDILQRSEYGNITATLRLLRLMVKYSDELKQHLEEPFCETPTKPWKGILIIVCLLQTLKIMKRVY